MPRIQLALFAIAYSFFVRHVVPAASVSSPVAASGGDGGSVSQSAERGRPGLLRREAPQQKPVAEAAKAVPSAANDAGLVLLDAQALPASAPVGDRAPTAAGATSLLETAAASRAPDAGSKGPEGTSDSALGALRLRFHLPVSGEGLQQALLSGTSGRYQLLPGTREAGRPIWKQVDGPHYLFVGESGKWIVGGARERDLNFRADDGVLVSEAARRGTSPLSVRRWRLGAHAASAAVNASSVFQVEDMTDAEQKPGIAGKAHWPFKCRPCVKTRSLIGDKTWKWTPNMQLRVSSFRDGKSCKADPGGATRADMRTDGGGVVLCPSAAKDGMWAEAHFGKLMRVTHVKLMGAGAQGAGSILKFKLGNPELAVNAPEMEGVPETLAKPKKIKLPVAIEASKLRLYVTKFMSQPSIKWDAWGCSCEPMVFEDTAPADVCEPCGGENPVKRLIGGVKNPVLPDDRLRGSSYLAGSRLNGFGEMWRSRLDSDGKYAWVGGSGQVGDFIEARFGEMMRVTHIVTRGMKESNRVLAAQWKLKCRINEELCFGFHPYNFKAWYTECEDFNNRQLWFFDRQYLKSKEGQKCLTYDPNKNEMSMQDCDERNKGQQWFMKDRKLRTRYDAKCLEYDTESKKVLMGTCKPEKFQEWRFDIKKDVSALIQIRDTRTHGSLEDRGEDLVEEEDSSVLEIGGGSKVKLFDRRRDLGPRPAPPPPNEKGVRDKVAEVAKVRLAALARLKASMESAAKKQALAQLLGEQSKRLAALVKQAAQRLRKKYINQWVKREKSADKKVSVMCNANGFKIISGGCESSVYPKLIKISRPINENGWYCEAHKGLVKGHAICSTGLSPHQRINAGGDWTTATCEVGQRVVGGGCEAITKPFKYLYNAPFGRNKWMCGGWGSIKKVWVICSAESKRIMTTNSGKRVTGAFCPKTHRLIGGGCHSTGSEYDFAFSRPIIRQWNCGGFMGPLQAFALCEPLEVPLKVQKQGCNYLNDEKSCVSSRDGRADNNFKGSICQWCCGDKCTESSWDRCEAKSWLLVHPFYIGHGKNGAGEDSCQLAGCDFVPPTAYEWLGKGSCNDGLIKANAEGWNIDFCAQNCRDNAECVAISYSFVTYTCMTFNSASKGCAQRPKNRNLYWSYKKLPAKKKPIVKDTARCVMKKEVKKQKKVDHDGRCSMIFTKDKCSGECRWIEDANIHEYLLETDENKGFLEVDSDGELVSPAMLEEEEVSNQYDHDPDNVVDKATNIYDPRDHEPEPSISQLVRAEFGNSVIVNASGDVVGGRGETQDEKEENGSSDAGSASSLLETHGDIAEDEDSYAQFGDSDELTFEDDFGAIDYDDDDLHGATKEKKGHATVATVSSDGGFSLSEEGKSQQSLTAGGKIASFMGTMENIPDIPCVTFCRRRRFRRRRARRRRYRRRLRRRTRRRRTPAPTAMPTPPPAFGFMWSDPTANFEKRELKVGGAVWRDSLNKYSSMPWQMEGALAMAGPMKLKGPGKFTVVARKRGKLYIWSLTDLKYLQEKGFAFFATLLYIDEVDTGINAEVGATCANKTVDGRHSLKIENNIASVGACSKACAAEGKRESSLMGYCDFFSYNKGLKQCSYNAPYPCEAEKGAKGAGWTRYQPHVQYVKRPMNIYVKPMDKFAREVISIRDKTFTGGIAYQGGTPPWRPLASNGVYGHRETPKDMFNWVSWKSRGIFQIDMKKNPTPANRKLYYKRKRHMTGFDIYSELLGNFRGKNVNKDFDLYSTLNDALSEQNAWKALKVFNGHGVPGFSGPSKPIPANAGSNKSVIMNYGRGGGVPDFSVSAYIAPLEEGAHRYRPAGLFPKPKFWLTAESYNTLAGVWRNKGSGLNIRDPVRFGKVEKQSGAGNGATLPISFLVGNPGTKIRLKDILGAKAFTICSLTRYAGKAKKSILMSSQWHLGFYNGQPGVAVGKAGWATGARTGPWKKDDWLAVCAKSGKITPTNVWANGVAVGKSEFTAPPSSKTLGTGTVWVNNDKRVASDFAIAEILVWQRELGEADIGKAMDYLVSVLEEGRSNKAATNPGFTTMFAYGPGQAKQCCLAKGPDAGKVEKLDLYGNGNKPALRTVQQCYEACKGYPGCKWFEKVSSKQIAACYGYLECDAQCPSKEKTGSDTMAIYKMKGEVKVEFNLEDLPQPERWYVAEDYDPNKPQTWRNRGSEGGKGDICGFLMGGKLERKVENGTKDTGMPKDVNMVSLEGKTTTDLDFGEIIKSKDFTFCSLTRYTGKENRKRILNLDHGGLFGHENGQAGVIKTDKFVSPEAKHVNKSWHWVPLCARTPVGGKFVPEDVLVNDKAVGVSALRKLGLGTVVVNSARDNVKFAQDKSDFQIAEMIVWDKSLPDMTKAMSYFMQMMHMGRDTPAYKVHMTFDDDPSVCCGDRGRWTYIDLFKDMKKGGPRTTWECYKACMAWPNCKFFEKDMTKHVAWCAGFTNCDFTCKPHLSKYTVWKGSRTIFKLAGGIKQPVIKTKLGREWVTIRCDGDQKLISGGCSAQKPPYEFKGSFPIKGLWRCGGYASADNQAFALCSAKVNPKYKAKRDGAKTTVDCGSDGNIIGGGCLALDNPFVVSKSIPDGNGWTCAGPSPRYEAFAVCVDEWEALTVEKTGKDWVSAECPKGTYVVGGGCEVLGKPAKMSYNGPNGNMKWTCGGFGADKKVYAQCVGVMGKVEPPGAWVRTFKVTEGWPSSGPDLLNAYDSDTNVTTVLEKPYEEGVLRIFPSWWKDFMAVRWEAFGCHCNEVPILDTAKAGDCQQCDLFNPPRRLIGPSFDKMMPDSSIEATSWKGSKSGDQMCGYQAMVRSRIDWVDRGGGAWCPSKTTAGKEMIKLKLPELLRVTHVVTKGRSDLPEWVESYKVGSNELQDTIIKGNDDCSTRVRRQLENPIEANEFMIAPQTWHGWMSMRLELYGCTCIEVPPFPPVLPKIDFRGEATWVTDNNKHCDRMLVGMSDLVKTMEDWKVRASKVTFRRGCGRGRLHSFVAFCLGSQNSIIKKNSRKRAWVQFDFGKVREIHAVQTQGRAAYDEWVTGYDLLISDNGIDWKTASNTGFQANSDRYTVVTNKLPFVEKARFLRLVVSSYHGAPSLRVNVVGCAESWYFPSRLQLGSMTDFDDDTKNYTFTLTRPRVVKGRAYYFFKANESAPLGTGDKVKYATLQGLLRSADRRRRGFTNQIVQAKGFEMKFIPNDVLEDVMTGRENRRGSNWPHNVEVLSATNQANVLDNMFVVKSRRAHNYLGSVIAESGLCLTADEYNKPGTEVEVRICTSGAKNQEFLYKPYTKQLKSEYGICVAGTADGKFRMARCNTGDVNQHFYFTRENLIVNGKCMESNRARLQQWKCGKISQHQNFSLQIYYSLMIFKDIDGFCLQANTPMRKMGRIKTWRCGHENDPKDPAKSWRLQRWIYSPITKHLRALYGICMEAPQFRKIGSHVWTWKCRSGVYKQQWLYKHNHLINYGSRLCVEAEKGIIELHKCDPDQKKQWFPSEHLFIVAKIKDKYGNCLDGRSSFLKFVPCTYRTKSQLWKIVPKTMQIGTVEKLCLDADEATIKYSKVVAKPCMEGRLAQQWEYLPATGRLKHKLGLCIENRLGEVYMYECSTGQGEQKWYMTHAPVSFEADSIPKQEGMPVATAFELTRLDEATDYKITRGRCNNTLKDLPIHITWEVRGLKFGSFLMCQRWCAKQVNCRGFTWHESNSTCEWHDGTFVEGDGRPGMQCAISRMYECEYTVLAGPGCGASHQPKGNGLWCDRKCQRNDCCMPKGVCTEFVCGQEHILVDEDMPRYCKGPECTIEECCVQKATCRDIDCPDPDLRIKLGGLPAFCKTDKCTIDECCVTRRQCREIDCPAGLALKPNGTQLFCNAFNFCVASECCVTAPFCDSFNCSAGWKLKNGSKQCQGYKCVEEECCDPPIDTCDSELNKDLCFKGMRRRPPEETPAQCDGAKCVMAECCENLGQCSPNYCPPGYVIRPEIKGKNFFCSTPLCTLHECCVRAGRCATHQCSEFWRPLRPGEGAVAICKGKNCLDKECCMRQGRCTNDVCPPGFKIKPPEEITEGCDLTECKVEECCDRLDVCGIWVCSEKQALKYSPPELCLGTVCRRDECCFQRGTCLDASPDYLCPPNQGLILKTDDLPEQCADELCTMDECCDFAKLCTPEVCPKGMVQTYDNYCKSATQCEVEECCAPLEVPTALEQESDLEEDEDDDELAADAARQPSSAPRRRAVAAATIVAAAAALLPALLLSL
eukprot:TRINITY_DN11411_c0_g4_i1.p1 TRINITY_DN11411_c0_g4~~TRINITY_DN11411_c0_g4_i1.p1  ORF type:complete len:4239 (+),score=800.52 TRINITY_DN11411_c0_g4_i1:23-12739(+)